ncbi:Protoheme IX farnesyltransferase [Vibrio chagasii]|uniref:heme o synthase n=1 Tax=Vibrio chagasii TaxID=170679 RepID=UPI001EFD2F0C|nr:heme o synthase [Vibrio chagasii]MDE9381969.1 heme o synthase [Vibrio alginolyticus]MCG9605849.1 heme o synthase [Vibrio chagasii]CAH6796360.1 Protoheme IX farnesyltransferase [Vibrio chagasii]CAH6797999.1 Protoheme IX farnesyltransferase [Vibrio chagasii]CAH6821740.1 Protoheme IX farnesyltransferase [Vibrio chagasii]
MVSRTSTQHQIVVQDTASSHEVAAQNKAAWKVYLTLTKPKVVALMLLTALVGMCLAVPNGLPLQQALFGMIGIGLMAGSAAAFNHLIDKKIDGQMSRTNRRPLPSGELSSVRVFAFAAGIGLLGFVTLALLVNPLTAWLTFASLLGYAVIYTMYLKRATPQNIVIAGIAGAMPPLLGWTAVTNELHSNAWLLVMIIFIWTPPHFWALAIHRRDEYAKVDIPMLPVTHGVAYTKTSILLYTLLLSIVCVLPVLVGMSSWIYLSASLVLNGGFVYHAWVLKYRDEPNMAMKTFKFSIYHLMILFVALLADHYLL